MTFSEVKVIWGHEVRIVHFLPISSIWRRDTCVWVVFSSTTRKMTLEHRFLHKHRNKMNIWNCMVFPQNAPKVAIFHIRNAIKTTLMKVITWNLVQTFFRHYSSTHIPFFWKFSNLGDFFCKNKHVEKNLKISKIFKISQIRDTSFVAHSFLRIPIFFFVFIF